MTKIPSGRNRDSDEIGRRTSFTSDSQVVLALPAAAAASSLVRQAFFSNPASSDALASDGRLAHVTLAPSREGRDEAK